MAVFFPECFAATRKLLVRAWKFYAVPAAAGFTLFCLLVVYAILCERFDYVRLPNGAILAPRGFSGDDAALLSPDGRQVVDSGVMEIVWNAEYVTGRFIPAEPPPVRTNTHHFIYRIGASSAEFFPPGDYDARLREVGLGESARDDRAHKTFGDLIRDRRYRCRWHTGCPSATPPR